jgi:hypothetical protein
MGDKPRPFRAALQQNLTPKNTLSVQDLFYDQSVNRIREAIRLWPYGVKWWTGKMASVSIGIDQ